MPCRYFRHAVGVVYVNGGCTRVNVVSHQIRGATSRACWLHRLRSQNLKVAQPNRTTERTSTPSGDRERPSLNRMNSNGSVGLSAAGPMAAMPNFCYCTGSFALGPPAPTSRHGGHRRRSLAPQRAACTAADRPEEGSVHNVDWGTTRVKWLSCNPCR